MMVRWSGEAQVNVSGLSGKRQISIWAWHGWTWNLFFLGVTNFWHLSHSFWTSDSIKVIPVFIHQGSVERGHVLSKRVQLICSKFIEFVIEEVDVVDKLYVGISNEELFEWEHQVIKRRDEEQILWRGNQCKMSHWIKKISYVCVFISGPVTPLAFCAVYSNLEIFIHTGKVFFHFFDFFSELFCDVIYVNKLNSEKTKKKLQNFQKKVLPTEAKRNDVY